MVTRDTKETGGNKNQILSDCCGRVRINQANKGVKCEKHEDTYQAIQRTARLRDMSALSVCNRTVITVDALPVSRPLTLCLVSPGLAKCELSIDCSHAGRVSFNRRATSESPCSKIRPDY